MSLDNKKQVQKYFIFSFYHLSTHFVLDINNNQRRDGLAIT